MHVWGNQQHNILVEKIRIKATIGLCTVKEILYDDLDWIQSAQNTVN